ncbi:MAG TPA: type VI secretion system baseplate subunit TssF [Pirellulales bacterium]|jgi:type VI secretion system protein ImpG|nr:type VI secretion system baseplate subunit TssF [Pirellulales bacterium]
MTDALERRYEDELTFIRRLGNEFARQRPKIADRLLLDRETGVSEDPHVERLIEAFAFLTARVRLKLDDDFSELTDALLNILYPHYLAPIPSMSIVQFHVDPGQGKLTSGYTLPRHSKLYSRTVRDVSCRFRTAYPVTLWPLEITAARYQTAPFADVTPPGVSSGAPALVRLELRTTGETSLAELQLDRLRLFLSGDDLTTRTLYELIFNHVTQVLVRAPGPNAPSTALPSTVLPAAVVRPVGFERDEGMLPYSPRSFPGYRLLTEYFTFPSKFMFLDIEGLECSRGKGYRDRLEIFLFLDRSVPALETRVKADTFRLGCAPIVNLFTQEADPIHLAHTKHRYHVIPDVRSPGAMEVYSIDAVRTTNLDTHVTKEYQPFYSFKHGVAAERAKTYWYARRQPSVQKSDAGTEMYISLVDLDFNPSIDPADVLQIQTTCTNRDLPGELRSSGGESWGFQLEGHAPVERIVPIVPPTSAARLPLSEGRWRLVSHLALNHLSIVDAEDGADALREILKLYDFANTKVSDQHIEGLLSVTSRRAVAPIIDGTGDGFCRGVEITVEFDEEKYAGSGAFLFASVLERFLGLYASINSATRLVARSRQRAGFVKRWPFRAGDKTLI